MSSAIRKMGSANINSRTINLLRNPPLFWALREKTNRSLCLTLQIQSHIIPSKREQIPMKNLVQFSPHHPMVYNIILKMFFY